MDFFSLLLDGANWTFETDGFLTRIVQHLGYTALAVLCAAVIAFPVGLLIGHTNRGSFFAINAGNAARALPTLGIVLLVVSLLGTGLIPVTVSLVALAIPPILTTTYAGIRSVDPAVVDAARGIGMRERQIVFGVELPVAMPIVFGGLRNATLQVVSTATIAAYVGLGGLGRYIIDGLALRDYPRVVAGAVLVALVAVALDQLLALVQRCLVSPGTEGRATSATGRRGASRVGVSRAAAPASDRPSETLSTSERSSS